MPAAPKPSPRFVGLLGLAASLASLGIWQEARAWAATPIKVACVGEQTTHSDQLDRTVEYPAMLQKELGATYDAENFGDCCATVLTGYPKQGETHPYVSGGSAPSYTQSLTFAPDVVVIGSWGKHDTEIADSVYAGVLDPAHFLSDYETLVTTYLNLPNKPRVYVSTPVPIPRGAAMGPTTDVILPAIEAIAAKYDLPVVDLYSVFLNQPQLYKDDTHVADVAGLQKIADTVFAELEGDEGDAGDDAGAPETGTTPAPEAGSVAEASVPVEPDGGPALPDPGAGTAAGDAPHAASSGGCSVASRPSSSHDACWLLLAGAVWLARARRRKEHAPAPGSPYTPRDPW